MRLKMKIITILSFCYIIHCVNSIELLEPWKSMESFEDIYDDDTLLREIDSYDESLEDVELYPTAEDIDGVYGHFDGRYRAFGHGKLKKHFLYPEPNRCAPSANNSPRNYVITKERLRKIRSEKMYWYFDKCGDNGRGDYQTDVHSSMPQIHKNFNFELPFFGVRYNYTRVSMNGYLEFTDPPEYYTYPLKFPVKDWPKSNDPSFIGIFFSKCRIGSLRPTDIDQRKPGVYFRVEENLQKRTDQFGVEIRERVKWDIRDSAVGFDDFNPKHVVIVTWKNVSFAGGIDSSLYKTNTFQLVLATDEIATFAIFNYKDIQWTSHTEAGGDTVHGEGGVAAFVGFNAGNGTQSFEYLPYSQSHRIRQLVKSGGANGFPGRHVFRIDNEIVSNNNVIKKILRSRSK